jgi:hypothetical protein
LNGIGLKPALQTQTQLPCSDFAVASVGLDDGFFVFIGISQLAPHAGRQNVALKYEQAILYNDADLLPEWGSAPWALLYDDRSGCAGEVSPVGGGGHVFSDGDG